MLSSSVIPHPLTVINRLQTEQLKDRAYVDYENDVFKGMVPCFFEEYFKDWNELRIIREYKEESRRVSN